MGEKGGGKGQELSKHCVPELVEKRLIQRPRSGAQDMAEKLRRKTDKREDQKEKRITDREHLESNRVFFI